MFRTNREDFFDSQQDTFFQSREEALWKEWRRRAEEDETLNELSAATGIVDRELLRELQRFDYDPASARLLRIVPLVQVAWSDGTVNSPERQRICQIAVLRGLGDEDSGWRKLVRYLEDRPSDEFFRLILRALRASLETAPLKQAERMRDEVLTDCASIALASGGLLGFGRIPQAERRTIEEITAALLD